MTWEMTAGLLRHVLTAAGGILASKGFIGSSDVEILTGAVIAIVGVIWSVVAKRKKAQ
jgi:hypothetical protein